MTAQPDIFLKPGEFHFGAGEGTISTGLGSCVSLTVWHPRLHCGGMCHYLLPTRLGSASGGLAGLYADGVMELFALSMSRQGTRPEEYQAKLFGGANMFPDIRASSEGDVGAKNIEAGRRLARALGLRLLAEEVGGNGHRRVVLDLATGDVWVRRTSQTPPPAWELPVLPDFGRRRA